MPLRTSLDLVIQPDGFILPNWTFLAFPYRTRENFFIAKIRRKKIIIFKKNLQDYFHLLLTFFSKKRTYREFSNFNAFCALKRLRDDNLKRRFLIYDELCKMIQRIDQLLLLERREDNGY